jgi:HK97 family phage major capsid protein
VKTVAERKRKDALKKRTEAEEMMASVDEGKVEEAKIEETIKAVGTLLDEADALEAEAKAADAVSERVKAAAAARPLNPVDDEPPANQPGANKPAAKAAAGDAGGFDAEFGAMFTALAAKAFAEAMSQPGTNGLKCFKGPNARTEAYRFGMWGLAALVPQHVPDAVKFCDDQGIAIKTAAIKANIEGQNALGGAVVPQEFSQRLIDLKESFGVIRANAYIEPMGSDTKLVPRRKGGLTAHSRGEAVNATQSQMAWDQIELTAKTATVYTLYSIELSEDAIINFGDRLMFEVAYAFTVYEDGCGFNGDGTSAYSGITGIRQALLDVSSNKGVITAATPGSWGAIVLEDLLKVVGTLPEYADKMGQAKWFASRNFYYQVMLKVALAAGGVTAAEIIAGVTSRSFMGYPVVFAQAMPRATEASKIEAIFGDLSLGTTFGNRRADTIALSEHAAFQSGQLAVRGDERFAFVAHDVGSATEPGPVIGLKT